MEKQFFAVTLGKKKIISVNEAFPPQELKEGQFEITKDEFDFLSKYHLDEVEIMVKNIRAKMEGVK